MKISTFNGRYTSFFVTSTALVWVCESVAGVLLSRSVSIIRSAVTQAVSCQAAATLHHNSTDSATLAPATFSPSAMQVINLHVHVHKTRVMSPTIAVC